MPEIIAFTCLIQSSVPFVGSILLDTDFETTEQVKLPIYLDQRSEYKPLTIQLLPTDMGTCVEEGAPLSPRPHTSHADPRLAAAQALSVACSMDPARAGSGQPETVFSCPTGA